MAPHAPVFNGSRYFWSHLPRGAYECPLEVKRKLTPDQINARIFHGRQEGEAHKNLVALLARLAEADPAVGSVSLEAYERPTEDMRSAFPFGRFLGTTTSRLWRMRRWEQEPSIPIVMAFAKLKADLRKAAARTFDALWNAVGNICNLFSPAECRNLFSHAGYASD